MAFRLAGPVSLVGDRVVLRLMAPLPALVLAKAALAQEAPDWSEVSALFADRCVVCHSGEGAPLGLHLDSYEGAIAGSEDGPVLVAGDPAASELVLRIRGESEPRMPLVGDPLLPDEIALIESWVEAGLPDGAAASAEPQPEDLPPGDSADEAPAEALAQTGLPGPGEAVTFDHVGRIFLQRCTVCHSDANPDGPAEGLRLDGLGNILEGGERLVLLPGNPEASEIVRRIEGTADPRMPFGGPYLSEEEILLIRQWIEQGAPGADGEPSPMPVGREVRYRGLLTGPSAIDGIEFQITSGTRIDDRPSVGEEAEVRGVVAEDGSIVATRFRDR